MESYTQQIKDNMTNSQLDTIMSVIGNLTVINSDIVCDIDELLKDGVRETQTSDINFIEEEFSRHQLLQKFLQIPTSDEATVFSTADFQQTVEQHGTDRIFDREVRFFDCVSFIGV
jgi:hypothetical protein